MKKITTHKLLTYAIHILCIVAAICLFKLEHEAITNNAYTTDIPQLFRYIAWIEITNMSQYAAKSGYDHKLGVFDSAGGKAAIQGMEADDLANGPAEVETAMKEDKSCDPSTQDFKNESNNQ